MYINSSCLVYYIGQLKLLWRSIQPKRRISSYKFHFKMSWNLTSNKCKQELAYFYFWHSTFCRYDLCICIRRTSALVFFPLLFCYFYFEQNISVLLPSLLIIYRKRNMPHIRAGQCGLKIILGLFSDCIVIHSISWCFWNLLKSTS